MGTHFEKTTVMFAGARMIYSSAELVLEELPAKPHKAKLSRLSIHTGYALHTMHLDAFMMDNLLQRAKLDPSWSFGKVAARLATILEATLADPAHADVRKIHGTSIKMDQLHYLEIEPVDAAPKEIECANFSFSASWTEFSAFSPGSTMSHPGDGEPNYSKVVSTSKAAARKLYKLHQEKPELFAKLTWSDVDAFLAKHRIAYKYQFSVWS